MVRHACRACRGQDGHLVLDLGEQPACDYFPRCDDPGPDPVHPLQMWFCASCALAQVVRAHQHAAGRGAGAASKPPSPNHQTRCATGCGAAAKAAARPPSTPPPARTATRSSARSASSVLDAIHGERGSGGRVVDGERGGFPGSGCGWLVLDDTVSVSESGTALPVIFCRSSGRAVGVHGSTDAHGRQQQGRRRGIAR
jgi:hypothetical protein